MLPQRLHRLFSLCQRQCHGWNHWWISFKLAWCEMSAALCFCAVCVHMMRVLFCDNGRKIGIILNFFKFRQCMSDSCHAQPQVIIPCADQAFALCRWRMCHMLFSILRKNSVYITQSDILHLPFLPRSKKQYENVKSVCHVIIWMR